ncbi:hypothetical protein KC19_4G121500 [Ceratodon purpureus]|uniref:Poly A polymerase head domain-containing protein n=1 Tax=Ceratodon purpureus TaxID=3225 RepID=A0A8T0I8E6_CERPU|nr:hypothetical protein KC19_4G121500 [Ceratodon purpureus]
MACVSSLSLSLSSLRLWMRCRAYRPAVCVCRGVAATQKTWVFGILSLGGREGLRGRGFGVIGGRRGGSWRGLCVGKEMGVEVMDTVQLTEVEEKIFGVLVATLQHFGLETELRVAGGWVRDKLLGKDSNDIDIALDNMLGKQFCEKVNEYLTSIGEETSGVGVIESNPEQSKHLETATMRVKGVWVDFVNLRAETYAQNSRIPTMEFGTAEQDALRRDLTINSMFYNINKRCVEDLTSRGLKDLKAGFIRTPLPSKETFLDDPLRVMRAVRFGARFGFVLDDELRKAASCDEVKAALGEKVSRERIGHEVDLMLMGTKPNTAMRNLEQLQLFPVIFTSILTDIKPPLEENIGRLCVDYMEAAGYVLVEFEGDTSTAGAQAKFTTEERRLFHLASLLLPLRHTTAPHPEKKKNVLPVPELIIKESLKLKSDDAKKVLQLHTAAEQFVNITEMFLGEEHERIDEDFQAEKRVQAGLLLGDIKSLWRLALVLSSVLHFPLDEASVTERANCCLIVESNILKLGLESVWTRKPLFDGRKVMSLLGLQKGGPLVKEWMGRFHKWELAHPEGTEEQCLEWFQEVHAKRQKLQ